MLTKILSWNMTKEELFFTWSPLWFTHFFHRCCSIWIPLVKKTIHPVGQRINNNRYEIIIIVIMFPSQLFGEQIIVRRDQIRRIERVMNKVQNYNHAQQPLKPSICVLEHCPNKTRALSSVFLDIWS